MKTGLMWKARSKGNQNHSKSKQACDVNPLVQPQLTAWQDKVLKQGLKAVKEKGMCM